MSKTANEALIKICKSDLKSSSFEVFMAEDIQKLKYLKRKKFVFQCLFAFAVFCTIMNVIFQIIVLTNS